MKKIILSAVIGLTAFASQASLLYWQVQSDDVESSTYEYAQLLYAPVGSSDYQTLDAVSKTAAEEAAISTSLDTLDDPQSYAFMIELANYDQSSDTLTGVATSEIQTYSQLAQVSIDTGARLSDSLAGMRAWTGGSYTAPEPTAAVLMMFGLAFLGLKRKNV